MEKILHHGCSSLSFIADAGVVGFSFSGRDTYLTFYRSFPSILQMVGKSASYIETTESVSIKASLRFITKKP